MKNKQNFEDIFQDALKCNRCGICLQNCPAYRSKKQEISSPRARVQIAALLVKKQINLKQDKNALIKCAKGCKNCFNCTVLCPAGINPQEINMKLKKILGIKPPKAKRNVLKNLFFRIYFKNFFTKSDNLFLTSCCDFKQIKQTLNILKQNGFESTLYKEIITPYFLEKLPNYKTYIFDDIENYRIMKNAVLNGQLNLNPSQILYITQIIKQKTIKLPEDSLIILSNIYLKQEMKEEEKILFEIFTNKTLNFINNRYYFGPVFHKKTLEYLRQIPQKNLITLSERENTFLKKLVKKYKLNKKVISINQIHEI